MASRKTELRRLWSPEQRETNRAKNRARTAELRRLWSPEQWETNRAKNRARQRKPETRRKIAAYRRDTKANYPRGTFEALCEAQHGRCFICGDVRELVADHNHETKRRRRPLCRRCNTNVGFIEGPRFGATMLYLEMDRQGLL